MKEPKKVLREVGRLLRPGSEFYMSVQFIYPVVHDVSNDYWRFTLHGVENVMTRNGLGIEEMFVHGNPRVAGLQMTNLGFLENCRDLVKRIKLIRLFAGVLVYPITFGINLLALPLIYLPLGKAGNFGCFLKLEKR